MEMEKRALNPLSLYFHMGPGLHSKVEALCFSSQFPHVRFLDQPHELSFAELVLWTQNTIKSAASETQGPITLLAHSFSAQLLREALPAVTDSVKHIRLLNPSYDSFDCFANIEEILFPNEARGREFWKTRAPSEKMEMLFKLAGHPQLNDLYWKIPEAQASYQQVFSSVPGLHIPSFIKAFSSYLAQSSSLQIFSWTGSVEIFYSLQDPLLKDETQVTSWLKIFPNAKLIETPGLGHYGLFESPTLRETFLAPK